MTKKKIQTQTYKDMKGNELELTQKEFEGMEGNSRLTLVQKVIKVEQEQFNKLNGDD